MNFTTTMSLTPFSCLVVFSCLWWICLFIVLPFGIKTDSHVTKGCDTGAPQNPSIGKKIIYTTILTLFLFGIYVVWMMLSI